MTDDDSKHDTEQAPTEQASVETTELAPVNHAEQVQAWSVDDGAEVESDSPPRGRWLSVGLVGLVVLVMAALIYLAATLFGIGSPKHAAPPTVPPPTTTAPVTAPPPPAVTVTTTPPPTVTVTAGPPAVEPTPVELTDTDRQFISKLRKGGIEYPFSNPGYPIGKAHAVCDYEAAHQQVAPRVDKSAQGGKWVEENTIWYGDNAVAFSSLAQATYCPQYLDGEY